MEDSAATIRKKERKTNHVRTQQSHSGVHICELKTESQFLGRFEHTFTRAVVGARQKWKQFKCLE